MEKTLPYLATTTSGRQLAFDFRLHPDTASEAALAMLASDLLAALDRRLGDPARIGNGDVLQSIALVLAVRARMVDAPARVIDRLVRDLVDSALASDWRELAAASPETH